MRHMEVITSEPSEQSATSPKDQDRLTRLRLCEEWGLVPAEDYLSMNRYNDAKIAELHHRLKVAERHLKRAKR